MVKFQKMQQMFLRLAQQFIKDAISNSDSELVHDICELML